MAGVIDFQNTFGARSQNLGSGVNNQDRPKAQFWLNVGYDSGVEDAEGKSRFISLPTGIPLDTQEMLPTNSRNQDYRQFNSARNDLLKQIMEVAKTLQPGEERELNLTLQLRRVNGEQEEIPADENQYSRTLDLVVG